MVKYALVELTGRVAQVEVKTFPIAEPFEWVQCGDYVTTEYRYVGGEFVLPAEQGRPNDLVA